MANDGEAVPADLLATAEWFCVASAPGAQTGPDDLGGPQLRWMPTEVPGTAASVLRSVGAIDAALECLDGQDWWYRCEFDCGETPDADGWVLTSDGLATLADVWLNGDHVLRSDSMYASHHLPIELADGRNELCIRFAALTPVLQERRPRPRWKSKGVSSQNVRWLRTTLLGRQSGWAVIPAPVGPWRPLSLRRAEPLEVLSSRVLASCPPNDDGTGSGTVSVVVTLNGSRTGVDGWPATAEVHVAGAVAPLDVIVADGRVTVTGEIQLESVERWWPHTHGDQPLYPVKVVLGGSNIDLGEVGFRTIETDRSGGGFELVVNGHRVFCRGAGWYPIDPIGYQPSDDDLESTVAAARAAGMNMLRIPGGTVYEEDRFYRACDRAGILVWQDMMLGPVDPPDDQDFLDVMREEALHELDRLTRHPAVAVVCGGQEVEEQPAMFGLDRQRWRSPVIHDLLPALMASVYPGIPYVSSSPSGGDFPFQVDAGVCHYFGVGICLFPLTDLRRSAVRFMSEGLAVSIPPERATLDADFGGDLAANLEVDWKRAVHRDAGSWFDIEDVRDHYAGSLFRVDIPDLWRSDPERAVDLGRAAAAEIMGAAVAEWRRPGSRCAGMLTIALRDLRPGPGWGLIDSSGRPKAPWYVLRRGFAPVAVLATDEGVNGLEFHLVNDTADAIDGTLALGLHTASHQVEQATHPVVVPARGGTSVRADGLFDSFRDLTYAYCFGPRSYELITADLVDATGAVIASTGYLSGGCARDIDPDVGLQAEIGLDDGGTWHVTVSSRRFAQYVQVDVPGYVVDDSWFHLPPTGSRTTAVRPEPGTTKEPRGRVRALNSAASGAITP